MRDGVLNLDKPGGMTSHDVVKGVRRILGVRKAGHTGTLDPLATGVLPICIGKATRIAKYISEGDKSYRATALFGIATDTQDADGTPVAVQDASRLTEADVLAVLSHFHGSFLQIPPMASAVRHQGRKLYELARAGMEVERQPRPVEVSQLELISFTPGHHPTATLDVTCSKGTYVRTLCADIGQALGVGAHLIALRRTRVGSFRLEDSLSLASLAGRAATGDFGSSFRSMEETLVHLPRVVLDPRAARRVCHGNAAPIGAAEMAPESVLLAFDIRGQLLAIGFPEQQETGWVFRPSKVLADEGGNL